METTDAESSQKTEQDAPKTSSKGLLSKRSVQVVLGVAVGVLLAGLGTAAWFVISEFVLDPPDSLTPPPNATLDQDDGALINDALLHSKGWLATEAPGGGQSRQPLYVGVLSLEPYLESRGVACNQTWGSSRLISRLQFFSHLRPGVPSSLPVVNLVDIPTDDYWHSYKTFGMLEYMCRQHGRRYAWFVRAVDDVYIDAAKLRTFLAHQDHTQKLLYGHPTQPVDDSSYQLLGGRGYCLGGPALILSQALLAEVCPHLPRCSSEYHSVRSDVALARCIATYADTECKELPQHMELFYHTYERNPLSVLEAVSRQAHAITLHPLKQPWMMYTHHQHVTHSLIHSTRQLLSKLESDKQQLVSHLSAREHNDTILTLRRPEPRGHEAVVFDSHGNMYHPQQCTPTVTMSPQQREEINQALLLANTSSRIGDGLQCSSLIGGYLQHDVHIGTTITTQLLCQTIQRPHQYKVTEVTMRKEFGAPVLKKDRRRDLSSQVVVLIHSNLADSRLKDLLLNLKIIASQVMYDVIVYIVLTPGLEPHKHSTTRNTYDVADIESWYKEPNLKVKLYKFDNGTDLSLAYTDIIRAIGRNYSDATVLLTETDVKYDIGFFQRCRAIVRPGKQVYHPYPQHTVFTEGYLMYGQKQQVLDVLWTGNPRPTCVHISDLKGHRGNRKKQTKHAALKAKNIKVTSTLDVGLSITY